MYTEGGAAHTGIRRMIEDKLLEGASMSWYPGFIFYLPTPDANVHQPPDISEGDRGGWDFKRTYHRCPKGAISPQQSICRLEHPI
jgi:hypothetical protein